MTDPLADADRVARTLRAQGHHPDAQDVDRVVRLLNGDITVEQAYTEVDAELGVPERAPVIAPTP